MATDGIRVVSKDVNFAVLGGFCDGRYHVAWDMKVTCAPRVFMARLARGFHISPPKCFNISGVHAIGLGCKCFSVILLNIPGECYIIVCFK